MTPTELIERLEKADAGSRELDAAIHCAIWPERITHPNLAPGMTMRDYGDERTNRQVASAEYIHKDRGPAPRYTTSLDAALTLVPEGWDWDIGVCAGDAEAFLTMPGNGFLSDRGDTEIYGRHKAPALALVIAALNARAGKDTA